MQNDTFVLEIPYGTRDCLPNEAGKKRAIENKLASLFSAWGYSEIVTPTIEYLDTLTMGNGSVLEPHMFKFFDRANRTLALRHEMTTPIARVVASRLRDAPLPLKLSYISSVFRYEQVQTGRQCEFYQAGVELIGSASAEADAEVVALAIESVLSTGLADFRFSLGQIEFVRGIMQQYGLAGDLPEKIKAAIESHDLVGLDAIIAATGLAPSARAALRKIPLLQGGESMLREAYSLALNEQSRRALDNLSEIYRLLKNYGVAGHVCFDLGVMRDSEYYTGMVFEAYTPGLGFSLCGGGRYDHMLSDFGFACPATGFALGIERVLLAMERQGMPLPPAAKDVYVAYAPGQVAAAIDCAQNLRGEGRVAELALSAQTEAEARSCQQAKGYRELRYLK